MSYHIHLYEITVFYRRQSITVTLPRDLTCDNCAVRLKRQGAEYGSTYFFLSCADVTILPRTSLRPTSRGDTRGGCFPGKCLNEGTCIDDTGECDCKRLYSGLRCQFEGEINLIGICIQKKMIL